MINVPLKYIYIIFIFCIVCNSIYGCSDLKSLVELEIPQLDPYKVTHDKTWMTQQNARFERYFQFMARTVGNVKPDSDGPPALKYMPKAGNDTVNWTLAVLNGLIKPRPSIDPNEKEEEPLSLNIFIEAKVPLMANVIFPHSIHTYWLSCDNCHPKIFIAEAGANPISMDEIFKGKWCGRCHGKVAFDFWPEAHCRRCHMLPKQQSGLNENF